MVRVLTKTKALFGAGALVFNRDEVKSNCQTAIIVLSHCMGQALIRKLNDETLGDYRSLARARGTSLEAELRDIIEANRPLRKKTAAELRRMSDEALAMSPPDGPSSDSTLIIRWDRDTNHGNSLNDGWSDDDIGR